MEETKEYTEGFAAGYLAAAGYLTPLQEAKALLKAQDFEAEVEREVERLRAKKPLFPFTIKIEWRK